MKPLLPLPLLTRMRWVRQQNLGGIGLWVLDSHSDPPERWSALEELLKPQATPLLLRNNQ